MEILYSVLILVVLVIVVIALYWLFIKNKPVVQQDTHIYNLSVAEKKHAQGDIKSYRYVIFFSGLFVSLMFATIMIEFPSFVNSIIKEEKDLVILKDELIDIPLTERTMSPPPPPPKQQLTTAKLIEQNDRELLDNENISLVLEPQKIIDDIITPFIEPEVIIDDPIEESPLLTPEQTAIFPGGNQALMKYVYDNFDFPQIEINNGNQGMIYVKFVIEKDGSVSNVEVVKGINGNLNNEAARVIQSLPKWTPARHGGRPVRMYFNLPIRLKVTR